MFINHSLAQKQDWNWYFGGYSALNFSAGVPIPVSGSAMFQYEGCATISDNNGSLLFYTNGVSVWNRNNIIMPNGTGLFGNGTTTQSALIVPKPDSSNIYYIFTADATHQPHGINYSEVDMSLASGLGDVTVKNVQLNTPATEKLCGVLNCNGTDYWVIVHGWGNNTYYSYPITNAGVGTPIISNVGAVTDSGHEFAGYLKGSPNGRKLAAAIPDLNIAEVYDFNNSTGIISNLITISNMGVGTYGIEFSPDNSKLYANGIAAVNNSFYQYDLSSNNQATIIASQYLIMDSAYLGSWLLGPDNKLYLSLYSTPYLAVVNSPNISGLGCNFNIHGVYLGNDSVLFGLPNFINYNRPITVNIDTSVCLAPYILSPTALGQSYLWSTGETTQTISVNNDATYWVQVYNANSCSAELIDTINLSLHPFYLNLGNDTTLCSGNPLTLNAGHSGANYHWSTGETTQTISVTTSGNYWVDVTNFGTCSGSDTIAITFLPAPIVYLGHDTTICNGQSIILNAGNSNSTYLWSTGATTQSITDSVSGTFWVNVSNGTCSLTDSINIAVQTFPLPLISFVVDTLTGCKPLLVHFTNTSINATSYLWSFSNGGTSQAVNPSHYFNSSGNYTVTLIGYNSTACGNFSDTSVQTFYYTVFVPPIMPQIINHGDTLIITNFTTGLQWYKDSTAIPGATNQSNVETTNACYYAIETDPNGCKSKSDTICFTTGINELPNHQHFSLFPNTNNGTFTLQYNLSASSSLMITDMLGREVYGYNLLNRSGQETLTLPLSQGIYFWQVLQEHSVSATGKLVIIK